MEGRGVSQLPPRRQHGRQRGWRAGGGGAARVCESRGWRRSPAVPAPGRPLFLAAPQCSAGRGHSRLREAGSREPRGPKAALTVSPDAHRPSAAPVSRHWRRGAGRAGGQDCVLGEPGARARGAGMSGSRLRGAPEPEPRGAFGVAMLRNPSPGRSVNAPMLGTL